MTIRLLTALLVFLMPVLTLAQLTQEEKENLESARSNADSNFVKMLVISARKTAPNDITPIYLEEAIRVAEKINYTKGLLEARDDLAMFHYLKGRLSLSLKLLLINQSLAVEKGDSIAVYNGLRNTATIHMKIGNIDMLRSDLNRRQYMLDNNKIAGITDTSYYVLSQFNSLAQFYGLPQINKPDSVTYYFTQMYKLGKNTSFENLWTQLGAGGIARSYARKANYDSSLYYSDIALNAALIGKRQDNYYSFLAVKAETFIQAGRLDSAFKTAYMVFDGASKNSYAGLLVTSSGLLAKLFASNKQYDSAVKYLNIESRYKDSVSGQEAIKNIQALTSEQQQKNIDKQREKEEAIREYKARTKNYLFGGGLVLLLLIIGILVRDNRQRAIAKKQIESAYRDLKNTQAQLVQSEKMASLGELTAGIAHEIQNPLNFVNNFSEVNKELIDEMEQDIANGNWEDVKSIAKDIRENEQKINHHGKRADAIVKGMLQHSRSSDGKKEVTDINMLCDEYLRLAYHGLKAKDKSFNAAFATDFDPSAGKINVIPQDIGRVLLNLFTNAFYAVQAKAKNQANGYQPTVSITTKRITNNISVSVTDNGVGISQTIIDKIFQPFFTTKPSGEGTGLGLSLAYDTIKAHGGELTVDSKENIGSTFTIVLPTT